MSYDREHVDQDDDEDLANECDLLASLIKKLKCEIDNSKNRNKFLETSNKDLVEKLKELDRYHDVKYAPKEEIDCAQAKGDLMSYKMEFWATATVHHHSIRFKMDNKKHIVNLESFREIHSAVIRNLTDVNINKLHRLWRSFAAIINKCLTEKSSGYGSLRLSQAQILSYTPKPKASVWKTRSSFDTTITPPTAAVAMTEIQQLKLVTKKSLQQTHITQASGSGVDERTGDGDGDDEDDDGKEDNDDDDQEDEADDGEDDEEDKGGDDEQAC
nr:hypothetical protein [Tanacetum cinerariifolium]